MFNIVLGLDVVCIGIVDLVGVVCGVSGSL